MMHFPKRKAPKDTIMLTSMMDMFTIILVFLLYNFSAEEQKDIKMPSDITVPQSSSEMSLEDAVNVTISQNGIFVDEKMVASIGSDHRIRAKIEGQKILPLYAELIKIKSMKRAKTEKEKENSSVILLKADKDVSFKVLDQVLKSAGMAGFPKSRFVVLRRES